MSNRPSAETFERTARRYLEGENTSEEVFEQRPVQTAVVFFGYDSGAIVNTLSAFVRKKSRLRRRSKDAEVIRAERIAEEPNLNESEEDFVRRRMRKNTLG